MTQYLVKARPKDNLVYLRRQLDSGAIGCFPQFGQAMQSSLKQARQDEEGYVLWEETCFCHPPLKQELPVLSLYFEIVEVSAVRLGEGWARIQALPSVWVEARTAG